VLGTSVLLTLVIACANVAILMIAQWTAREHEIAIRAAIGASRGRVVRTLVTESVVIAIASGVLGVGATIVLQTWVVSRAPSTVFFDLSVDPRVFLQAAIVTVMSGLAAGLAPALYETRRLQTNPLRSMAGSDRVRQRWRQSLVVLEIMVTVALLVETAALVDGYQRASRAALGFDTHSLLIVRVENPSGVPADAVANALMRLPGAAAAAATASVPYATFGSQSRVATDGSASGAIVAEQTSISDTFFSTLGIPLRAGRPFARSDAQGSRVAIINETMARRLFEGESPLGRHIWVGGVPYDIVGIAADYSNNPLRYPDVDPKVFLPLAAGPAAPRAQVCTTPVSHRPASRA